MAALRGGGRAEGQAGRLRSVLRVGGDDGAGVASAGASGQGAGMGANTASVSRRRKALALMTPRA